MKASLQTHTFLISLIEQYSYRLLARRYPYFARLP